MCVSLRPDKDPPRAQPLAHPAPPKPPASTFLLLGPCVSMVGSAPAHSLLVWPVRSKQASSKWREQRRAQWPGVQSFLPVTATHLFRSSGFFGKLQMRVSDLVFGGHEEMLSAGRPQDCPRQGSGTGKGELPGVASVQHHGLKEGQRRREAMEAAMKGEADLLVLTSALKVPEVFAISDPRTAPAMSPLSPATPPWPISSLTSTPSPQGPPRLLPHLRPCSWTG